MTLGTLLILLALPAFSGEADAVADEGAEDAAEAVEEADAEEADAEEVAEEAEEADAEEDDADEVAEEAEEADAEEVAEEAEAEEAEEAEAEEVAEEAPEEESDADAAQALPAPVVTPTEPRLALPDSVGLGVGLQLGPAISFAPLSTAFSPRLEVFVEPPVANYMVRGIVSVGHLRPAARGTVTDERLGDGSATYDVRQSEWLFSFGGMLRLNNLDLPVVPEASLAPTLYLLRSRADGEAGGQAFGESREAYARLGLLGSVGASYEMDVLELTFHLVFAGSGLNGVVTGQSSTTAITPMIGARLLLL